MDNPPNFSSLATRISYNLHQEGRLQGLLAFQSLWNLVGCIPLHSMKEGIGFLWYNEEFLEPQLTSLNSTYSCVTLGSKWPTWRTQVILDWHHPFLSLSFSFLGCNGDKNVYGTFSIKKAILSCLRKPEILQWKTSMIPTFMGTCTCPQRFIDK